MLKVAKWIWYVSQTVDNGKLLRSWACLHAGATKAMLADLLQQRLFKPLNHLQRNNYDAAFPHMHAQRYWPFLESFDYSSNTMYGLVAACIGKSGATL